MNANARRLGGWLLGVPVAVLGLAACGNELHAAGSATPLNPAATSTTSSSTSPKAPTTTEAHDVADDDATGSTDHHGNSGGSGGGSSRPTAKVVSLTVVQQPSCPVHGTADAPYSSPGNPVVVSWKVSGAPGAAIGVDNPGTYGAYGSDYPVSGTETFQFGCEGDSGTTSHKFTVWPKDHPEVSKTIVVTARNNP